MTDEKIEPRFIQGRRYTDDATLTIVERVLAGEINEMIAARIEEILVPGLRAFLELHRDDPMAVASNAERENLDFVLDRARLRSYFRVVVDGHQARHPKPHPELYLRTAQLLGVAPVNCLIFEDSYYGVEAARVAGARVIGVLTTHGDLPGTALTIDNFGNGDLAQWLRAQEPMV